MVSAAPDTGQEPPARSRSSPLWYLFSTGASAALPLVVLPFVTSALAPEEYGAWVLAYAFGVVVSGLASVGLPLVYERSYFEAAQSGETSELLWTTVSFIAATLALALAATWTWREQLASAFMQDHPQPALLFWTACAVGASSVKTCFLLYFRNAADARRHALFTLQEVVLAAVLTVLLVAHWRVGPLGLAWGPLAASLFVLVQLTAHFVRRVPPRLASRQLGQSLALALPMTPRLALGIFGQVFDKWVVGAVAATGGVAAYAIGQRLGFVVFAFSTALENVFQPKTYQLMFEGPHSGAALGRMLTPFAYATVGVALAVGLGAQEAVAILAPDPYAGAIPIATVLALHYALLFFGKQPQLMYARKTGIVAALGVGSTLFSAAAMYLLALRYGPVGAAAGTALSGAVMTFIAVIVSQRHYRIDYERRALLLMYSYLVIALAAVQLVSNVVPYTVLLAIKLALIGLYAAAGLARGYWRVLIDHASTRTAGARA